MNDILSSQAFQEFLQKRAEEIVSENDDIRKVDLSVTEAEDRLKCTLSQNQLNLFLQYEKLCSDYQLLAEKEIYKQCLRDVRGQNNLG